MTYEFPESATLAEPYKIEGKMSETKDSFYELARNRIRIFDSEGYKKWFDGVSGIKEDYLEELKKSPAGVVCWPKYQENEKGDIEKMLTTLEIIVNKDAFQIGEKDYSDLIPFVVEHELMEGWLSSKKGWGDHKFKKEDRQKKHLLAERKEFLLAEQQGLGERLLEWRMLIDPSKEKEYLCALESAKKKIKL